MLPRAVPLKRPKAAIPIVAPPAIDTKGKVDKDENVASYDSDVGNIGGQEFESGNYEESNIQ